jgi:predicted transcriptional regulator
MIWNKVGFVLASTQRREVFNLIKGCRTIDEIELKVRITTFTGVKRILKDFEKEGLIKIDGNKIQLTKMGKEVMKKIIDLFCSNEKIKF